jgi:hypothetical protein
MRKETSNLQLPTSNETPATKHPCLWCGFVLAFGDWSFSGAWGLGLGIFCRRPEPLKQGMTIPGEPRNDFFSFRVHDFLRRLTGPR